MKTHDQIIKASLKLSSIMAEIPPSHEPYLVGILGALAWVLEFDVGMENPVDALLNVPEDFSFPAPNGVVH